MTCDVVFYCSRRRVGILVRLEIHIGPSHCRLPSKSTRVQTNDEVVQDTLPKKVQSFKDPEYWVAARTGCIKPGLTSLFA